MNTIKSFEDLEIWKEGMRLASNIYKILKDSTDFGLKNQFPSVVGIQVGGNRPLHPPPFPLKLFSVIFLCYVRPEIYKRKH